MGMHILVVDDSSIMRRMIREVLHGGEHEIAGEAKNGMDAIEMYKSLAPEIVVMDVTMRGMNGLEAARKILEYDPSARIVFLSNLEEDRYSREAISLGAKGYFSKHDPEKILNIIRDLEVSSQSESALRRKS